MARRLMLWVGMMLLFPALAHAWTISARVSAGQGSIADGSLIIAAAPVPSPPPPSYINLPSSTASRDLTVTPASGYSLSAVLIDGKAATPVAPNTYRVYYNAVNSHTIAASFTAQKVTVSAVQAENGTFTLQQITPVVGTPTTSSLSVLPGSKIKVRATPNSGYRVEKIRVNGIDYPPPVQLEAGAAYEVTDIVITGATTVTASYLIVPSIAPALSVSPSSGFVGDTIAFDATGTTSNDSGLSYAFSVTDSNGTVLHSRPASSQMTDSYSATTVGTFTVIMTATTSHGGVASRSASFTIVDRSAYESAQCSGCHTNRDPQIVADYNASPHQLTSSGGTGCQGCHTTSPHGNPIPDGQICADCHNSIPGRVPAHPIPAWGTSCGSCHSNVHKASANGCNSCHDCPPATPSHQKHFGGDLSQARYGDTRVNENFSGNNGTYLMSCGNCHPLDFAKHGNQVVDVELFDAQAPAGSVKALNPATAAYAPGSEVLSDSRGFPYTEGSCSNVYCHSSGQQYPTYQTTPSWNSAASMACNGCHGNPPAYPSGAPGSPQANSHLQLADDGYEWGHFLGMPGPWHTSKHGGNWSATDDSAPITCQTCHYETADPGNIRAENGFYYLDTTGSYSLPGGDPGRITNGWQEAQQCGSCHTTGSAAGTGGGKVLPRRHVNGKREVTFDQRESLPVLPWLPAPPNRPTKPYWITTASNIQWPNSVTYDGTTVSFSLKNATYDPATKTCSTACHVKSANPPAWGGAYGWSTCGIACHPYLY